MSAGGWLLMPMWQSSSGPVTLPGCHRLPACSLIHKRLPARLSRPQTICSATIKSTTL